MRGVDGLFFRICTWISYFIYLNVLFLLSCIPVLTIGPALAALFGVARYWAKGDEPAILAAYGKLFRENLRQGLLVGAILTGAGFFLLQDTYVLVHTKDYAHPASAVALAVVALLTLSFMLHVFPLMVNRRYSTGNLMVSALGLALYRPHVTLLNVLVVVTLLYACLLRPLLFLFYFSAAALLTYRLVSGKLAAVERLIAAEEKETEAEQSLVSQILVDERDSHGTLPDAGGNALHRAVAHVAGGEDTRRAGL